MRSPDFVDRVEGLNPTLITASPPQPCCDRPIESCLVSRYLLIHKQGIDSTQPNLQRGAIALEQTVKVSRCRSRGYWQPLSRNVIPIVRDIDRPADMESTRWDETWHRLREWTNGQAPSERLAAQILSNKGFEDIDPSHPLGGRDGGRDAICTYKGEKWVMAVYFPRGQKSFSDISAKLQADISGATRHDPSGIAFVTNQELLLSERQQLKQIVAPLKLELFHLERLTMILDSPPSGE